MNKVSIKPLSVNEAWKGRRFKTDAYKRYELVVSALLEPLEIPQGKLSVHLVFGMSSAGSDWDNPIKPFVDILQKKYGFNDNRIKHAVVDVVRTKKGEEYIEFEIRALSECPDDIKEEATN